MYKTPVIDTHVHLWDPALLRYPWLDDIPLLNRAYLPENYHEESKEANVKKIVFIQCECEPSQYKQEVQWVTSLKNTEKRIAGDRIVGAT